LDRQIWDALCKNETDTNPTDCNAQCFCVPPPPLLSLCSNQNPSGVCKPGNSCLNGTCQGPTAIDGVWTCQNCEVGSSRGIVTLQGGNGQYIAGSFIISFTYSYTSGNIYTFNLPDLGGTQNATLINSSTLQFSGDTWNRRS
jgi:hypothetical protein